MITIHLYRRPLALLRPQSTTSPTKSGAFLHSPEVCHCKPQGFLLLIWQSFKAASEATTRYLCITLDPRKTVISTVQVIIISCLFMCKFWLFILLPEPSCQPSNLLNKSIVLKKITSLWASSSRLSVSVCQGWLFLRSRAQVQCQVGSCPPSRLWHSEQENRRVPPDSEEKRHQDHQGSLH